MPPVRPEASVNRVKCCLSIKIPLLSSEFVEFGGKMLTTRYMSEIYESLYLSKAILIKCFVSHHPTEPFFST